MGDGLPGNQGFMTAAYTIAALILLAYTVVLWRRGRRR